MSDPKGRNNPSEKPEAFRITVLFAVVATAALLIYSVVLYQYEFDSLEYFIIHLLQDSVLLILSSNILFVAIYRYEKKQKHMLKERRRAEETLSLFGRVFHSVSESIIIADHKGRIQYVNPAFLRNTGYSWKEVLGHNPDMLKSGLHEAEFYIQLWASVHTSGNWQGEIWNRRKNGENYPQQLTITSMRDDKGTITNYVGIFTDISDQKKAEDLLRLHAKVFENSDEGIMITDKKGIIISVNPAFSSVTGYSWAEAVGQTPRILHSGRQDAEFYINMWASIHAESNWQGEIWNRKKNGENYLEWLSINSIRDDDGQITHYIGIFYDITIRKQSEDHLRFLAHYDALTSLPNRALFHDRLNQTIMLAERQHTGVTLMFIDLDNFKHVNDTLGHDAGDKLLQRVAGSLVSSVRKSDTVSRLSGDEFTIILPHMNDKEATAIVAQKILDKLAEPSQIGDHQVFTTASIGIAAYPMDSQDADSLIKHADWAMYRAKSSGNAYYMYSDDMHESITRRMMLEKDLRNVLENGELFVYYQPQVNMVSGGITGIEALIRWKHPEFGYVPPIEFIPITEETGQILEIGEWVIQTVCNQNKAWQDAGIPCVKISVNLSARQIEDAQFADRLRDILKESGLDPKYLGVEITENISIYNIDLIFQKLNAFRSMGIEVSIDDFGTGHSSLGYLRKYPFNILKLDKSFIDGIEFESKNETIVKAVIDIACGLELEVIAEGVETQEQLSVLMRLGCETIQGYLFSAPMPAIEMEAMLTSGK